MGDLVDDLERRLLGGRAVLGDIVRVKVLDVDVTRKRIGLTLRLDDEANATPADRSTQRSKPSRPAAPTRPQPPTGGVFQSDHVWRPVQRVSLAESLARAPAITPAALRPRR
jgi:transcriptional accessory protein Tex/SPT6